MTRATAVLSVGGVLWLTPGIPAQEALTHCQEWNTEEFFRTATVDSVTACLEAGAHPNTRNKGQRTRTPLHWAAGYNQKPKVIEALLAAGADPNAETTDKWTPLHAGAEKGNLMAIQALLDAGADANVRTDWAGMSPLHLAAQSRKLAVIQALLAAGAYVDGEGTGGYTPLSLAVNDGNVAVIKVLLAAGADPMKHIWGSGAGGGDSSTPLDDAIRSANSLVVEVLQAAVKSAGQDCNLWNTKRYFQAAPPSSVVACLGTGSNPRAKDAAGITPLHRAAGYNENPAVIQVLLDAGADLEAQHDEGYTPLRWAINPKYWDQGGNPNLSVIQTLLDAGADTEARDNYGHTLLRVALGEVSRSHSRHNRPLHYPAVIQLVLDAGADPNSRDRSGTPLLHEAATGGVYEHGISATVTEALLSAGADPKMKDNQGRTPLHMVAWHNPNLEVVQALLVAGAEPETRDDEGRVPLHGAVGRFAGNPEVIRALLAAGADLEVRDDEGRTPMHVAAAENLGAVEYLIEAGADLEVRDEDGDTPLHGAAANSDTRDDRDVVAGIMALLAAGADPLARNGAGKTPWEIARANEKLKGSDAYWWLRAAHFGVPGDGASSASDGVSESNSVVSSSSSGLVGASGKPRVQRQAREGLPYEPEMVNIPEGSFRMGCVSGQGCFSSEKPVHEVRVESFELGKYEVTFEEYDRFTAATGSERASDGDWGRGKRPVFGISWKDALAYAEWLSAETGKHYRLPSEAEWEYAARAGAVTAYSWGNGIDRDRANCADYCGSQWDDRRTAPVGSFAPNGWGLHDMHGNVWEWVQDCWNRNYLGAPEDGTAWNSGDCSRRVMRGGSWSDYPRHLRSAARYWYSTGIGSNIIGFRLARTIIP